MSQRVRLQGPCTTGIERVVRGVAAHGLVVAISRRRDHALAAGTPLVGVGLQMEQQINLDQVMDAGAGIRIRQRWRAPVIRRAVSSVLADPGYRRHAEALAGAMRTMDGPATAAERMWEFLLKL